MKYIAITLFALILSGCGLYGGGEDKDHDYNKDKCDYTNPDRDLPENRCGAGNGQ